MLLHYCVTDAQSQAGTPVFSGKEWIKNPASVVFRNPGSVIHNAHLQNPFLGKDSTFKDDLSLPGNRLNSVLYKIEKELA